jgi:hypothetical protein
VLEKSDGASLTANFFSGLVGTTEKKFLLTMKNSTAVVGIGWLSDCSY